MGGTETTRIYRDGDSTFVEHAPCPECGSKDNLAVYTDHAYCFGCGHYEGKRGEKMTQPKKGGMLDVEYRPLLKRHLKEDTCKKWGYGVGTYQGQPVQVASYRDTEGKLVAQKVRLPGKKFTILGDSRKLPTMLYGRHLWQDGGKMIVVTEGEVDALSVNQAQGLKWPCVSVPNGAAAAPKAVAANLEYLESFGTVIFLLDQDEPGQTAAIACAELLTPGKAKIAAIPRKDANEMLVRDSAVR